MTLMPLLFSLGIHDALSEVQQHLQPGECLFAYLDDVYVLSSPERIREVYNMLETTLRAQAGIQLHTGKTRTWNVAGERPEDMEDLGPDVWNLQGVKILGSPVGCEEFVSSFIERRLADEQKLWDAIPSVPDLQCAWQVLLQCAGPRCHHLLRTVPPSLSEVYAQGHDAGMQRTMESLLRTLPGDNSQIEMARHITSVPLRMGGLGLRSAQRLALAAYWASWADALPMLQQRLPTLTRQVVECLSVEGATGVSGRFASSIEDAGQIGFVNRPSWEALQRGIRPQRPTAAEPGEWQHGWQYYSSSLFRAPLSGDGSACPVMCCRPSPLEVAFRSMCQFGPLRVTHVAGVQQSAPWPEFTGRPAPQ